jgi:hypothetical protein
MMGRWVAICPGKIVNWLRHNPRAKGWEIGRSASENARDRTLSKGASPGSQAGAWEPRPEALASPGKLELPDQHDPVGTW